jgi:hypothetical protein
MSTIKRVSLILAMVAVGAGCEGRTAMRIYRDGGAVKAVVTNDAGTTATAAAQCPEGTSPRVVVSDSPIKLDLLFMIDDSPSMQEEQANLARNFPRLIEELKKMPAGLPDLHLGVVSSDMGAGTANLGSACGNSLGDRGVLQVRGGCGLDASRGRFLISQNGGTDNNFQGDIADVFACMANLGTAGCGFEHQLQSVRVALSGFVADNAGFLRSDAHLAVVYITDEDDCSAPADTTMFGAPASGQDGSLRCSLAGHVCNGKPVPASVFSTPLANCSAAPDGGGKLIPVNTFIDAMKQLHTQSVSVSVIGGWPSDPTHASYALGYDSTSTYPELLTSLPICESANGKAVVELRMKQFVDAFGSAGKILSICQDDFSDAMAQIGALISTTVECQ